MNMITVVTIDTNSIFVTNYNSYALIVFILDLLTIWYISLITSNPQ